MRFVKFVLLILLTIVILLAGGLFYAYIKIPKIDTLTTILILGKGGEGHTAPNLTDTIMVAFLNPDSKRVSLLSIPRDIWITEIRAKINTAYHYGGFKMANDSVSSVTGILPSNTVVVDFSLFKDIIDAIGGIEVDVENYFVDDKYPIAGLENDLCNGDRTFKCRYEVVEFKKGIQNMNGETALKFVRSRNSKGDEGTDLAREKRQQKVISAVKNKLISGDVLLNLESLRGLYQVAVSHLETDISYEQAISLGKFIFNSRDNISFISIPEDLLRVSQNDKKYDKQYVFLPKSGNWKKIQEWLSKSI